MTALQLTLDLPMTPAGQSLAALDGSAGLVSPWCEAPADLLAAAWAKIAPKTNGRDRLEFRVSEEDAFEVARYPFGWAVISTRDRVCGYMGSCMNKADLGKILRRFIKQNDQSQP